MQAKEGRCTCGLNMSRGCVLGPAACGCRCLRNRGLHSVDQVSKAVMLPKGTEMTVCCLAKRFLLFADIPQWKQQQKQMPLAAPWPLLACLWAAR